MTFKLTTKVLDLVAQLYEEGYTGRVELTSHGASGTKEIMHKYQCKFWLELGGFAKETLNLAEDEETGDVWAVGRYSMEGVVFSVEDIVRISWRMFTYYEERGYGMPFEFMTLYEKYGFIEKKSVTKTEIVRKK